MKKFKQLLEDIELMSGLPRTTKRDMQHAQMEFEDNVEFRKNIGKIHKDYSLHRTHNWSSTNLRKKIYETN